jgi:hypothetical protein
MNLEKATNFADSGTSDDFYKSLKLAKYANLSQDKLI